VGIYLPLQLKTNKYQHASFRYKPVAGSLLPPQDTEPVSNGKCGKIISHECEWTFRNQLFAAEAPWIWISQIGLH
jgi:hypothetical protein